MALFDTAGREMFAKLGGWLHGAGNTIAELFSGSWVKQSSINFKTGIRQEVFANGVEATIKQGTLTASVPKAWMQGSESLLTQLRQGSWVRRESFSFVTKTSSKEFANGVKVVTQGGGLPHVTLPKGLLEKLRL